MVHQIVAGTEGGAVNNFNRNQRGRRNVVLSLCPGTLFSLLDIMRLVHAGPIALLTVIIQRYEYETDWRRGVVLSKKRADFMLQHFKQYENYWGDLRWDNGHYRVEEVVRLLKWGNDVGPENPRLPLSKLTQFVNKALGELSMALSLTVDEYQFVLVDKKNRDFVEDDDLFGKSVSEAFPSAKADIKAAGDCIAVDLNTAAVFHLMRAAELGMRALAVHLKVRLTHKGKPKPIEHGGWEEIINHIENKIQERRDKYDKAVKKNRGEFEFLKFCRIMADELYKFKEYDRNDTMHSIRSYNEGEAKGVFDRVRDFMQKLSTKVSETNG
jgi:hypothetical protein